MFRNRAIIYRILRYSLVITIHATAPAYAEQSFDTVAGSWSGSGSMKPADGPRESAPSTLDVKQREAICAPRRRTY
jgi:hypothetical protein